MVSKEMDLQNALASLDNVRADLKMSQEKCQKIQTDWTENKAKMDDILAKKDQELQDHYKKAETSDNSAADWSKQIDILKAERDQIVEALSQSKKEHADVQHRLDEMSRRARAADLLADKLKAQLFKEKEERKSELMKLKSRSRELIRPPSNDQLHSAHARTGTAPPDVVHLAQSLSEREGRIRALIEEMNALKLRNMTVEKLLSRVPRGGQLAYGEAVTGSKPVPKRVIDKVSFGVYEYLLKHPFIRIGLYTYIIAFQLLLLPFIIYSPDV